MLVADGSLHGYTVDTARTTKEPNGGNDLTIGVSRAPATLIFAGFIMLLMWTVTLLALMLSAKLICTGAAIDTPLISLLGVLLFAFTAIRNSMPNAPALGALADYLSYFWCEVALGVGLVALLTFPHPPKLIAVLRERRNYLSSNMFRDHSVTDQLAQATVIAWRRTANSSRPDPISNRP